VAKANHRVRDALALRVRHADFELVHGVLEQTHFFVRYAEIEVRVAVFEADLFFDTLFERGKDLLNVEYVAAHFVEVLHRAELCGKLFSELEALVGTLLVSGRFTRRRCFKLVDLLQLVLDKRMIRMADRHVGKRAARLVEESLRGKKVGFVENLFELSGARRPAAAEGAWSRRRERYPPRTLLGSSAPGNRFPQVLPRAQA
jgi:hypothetical protein